MVNFSHTCRYLDTAEISKHLYSCVFIDPSEHATVHQTQTSKFNLIEFHTIKQCLKCSLAHVQIVINRLIKKCTTLEMESNFQNCNHAERHIHTLHISKRHGIHINGVVIPYDGGIHRDQIP